MNRLGADEHDDSDVEVCYELRRISIFRIPRDLKFISYSAPASMIRALPLGVRITN